MIKRENVEIKKNLEMKTNILERKIKKCEMVFLNLILSMIMITNIYNELEICR